MVFRGTIAAINTALEGMTFDPMPEYNGAASVQIITDDQGNTGSGGPLTDDDTVAITVKAIDDAPINNVPVTQSVDEDTILTFSAGGSNAISISDVDAGSGDMGRHAQCGQRPTHSLRNGRADLHDRRRHGRRLDGVHGHDRRDQHGARRHDVRSDAGLQRRGERADHYRRSGQYRFGWSVDR